MWAPGLGARPKWRIRTFGADSQVHLFCQIDSIHQHGMERHLLELREANLSAKCHTTTNSFGETVLISLGCNRNYISLKDDTGRRTGKRTGRRTASSLPGVGWSNRLEFASQEKPQKNVQFLSIYSSKSFCSPSLPKKK